MMGPRAIRGRGRGYDGAPSGDGSHTGWGCGPRSERVKLDASNEELNREIPWACVVSLTQCGVAWTGITEECQSG